MGAPDPTRLSIAHASRHQAGDIRLDCRRPRTHLPLSHAFIEGCTTAGADDCRSTAAAAGPVWHGCNACRQSTRVRCGPIGVVLAVPRRDARPPGHPSTVLTHAMLDDARTLGSTRTRCATPWPSDMHAFISSSIDCTTLPRRPRTRLRSAVRAATTGPPAASSHNASTRDSMPDRNVAAPTPAGAARLPIVIPSHNPLSQDALSRDALADDTRHAVRSQRALRRQLCATLSTLSRCSHSRRARQARGTPTPPGAIGSSGTRRPLLRVGQPVAPGRI